MSADVVTVPRVPTDAMLNAARDWSLAKYGLGIGNDAAIGCWVAMLSAVQPAQHPRTAGRAAYRPGGDPDALNPHPSGTTEWTAWRNGWFDGHEKGERS